MIKIAFQKKGTTANTILFLHQNSGSSAIWDKQIKDECFKEFTIICLDIPGHGISVNNLVEDSNYGIQAISLSILNAISDLKLENYVLVSLSLGCNIVGEIANKLVNCKGFFMIGASLVGGAIKPQDVLLPLESSMALFTEQPVDSEIDKLMRDLIFNQDENQLKKLKQDYQSTDPKFRTGLAKSIQNEEWTDEIQNLAISKLPIIFVFGKEEKIINLNYIKNPAFKIWENRIFLIENAGHLPNLDAPQILNTMLLDFTNEALI